MKTVNDFFILNGLSPNTMELLNDTNQKLINRLASLEFHYERNEKTDEKFIKTQNLVVRTLSLLIAFVFCITILGSFTKILLLPFEYIIIIFSITALTTKITIYLTHNKYSLFECEKSWINTSIKTLEYYVNYLNTNLKENETHKLLIIKDINAFLSKSNIYLQSSFARYIHTLAYTLKFSNIFNLLKNINKNTRIFSFVCLSISLCLMILAFISGSLKAEYRLTHYIETNNIPSITNFIDKNLSNTKQYENVMFGAKFIINKNNLQGINTLKKTILKNDLEKSIKSKKDILNLMVEEDLNLIENPNDVKEISNFVKNHSSHEEGLVSIWINELGKSNLDDSKKLLVSIFENNPSIRVACDVVATFNKHNIPYNNSSYLCDFFSSNFDTINSIMEDVNNFYTLLRKQKKSENVKNYYEKAYEALILLNNLDSIKALNQLSKIYKDDLQFTADISELSNTYLYYAETMKKIVEMNSKLFQVEKDFQESESMQKTSTNNNIEVINAYVVQDLGLNTYEILTDANNTRAILTTNNTSFTSRGWFTMNVIRTGTTNVKIKEELGAFNQDWICYTEVTSEEEASVLESNNNHRKLKNEFYSLTNGLIRENANSLKKLISIQNIFNQYLDFTNILPINKKELLFNKLTPLMEKEEIIRILGEPLYEEKSSPREICLQYNFGKLNLYYRAGEMLLASICINNDEFEGPRGIRVNESSLKALTSFISSNEFGDPQKIVSNYLDFKTFGNEYDRINYSIKIPYKRYHLVFDCFCDKIKSINFVYMSN